MKLIKKITAAVTAMAMAASMMSIGASASELFGLYYSYSAPSNAIRTFQEIGDDEYNPVFLSTTNCITMTTYVSSFNTQKVRSRDYKYNFSTNTWEYINSLAFFNIDQKSCYKNFIYVPYHTPLKVIVDMEYGSMTYASAYGTTEVT